MTRTDSQNIHCIVCPESCCSWKMIPGCDPLRPGKAFQPPVEKPDYFLSDFFGQFIQTETLQLSSRIRARFHDCRPVRCPKCEQLLPLNTDADGYLLCANCNIRWDMLPFRPIQVTFKPQSKQLVLL